MEPIIVEFPLRGEWVAPHTPGHKIPSHGWHGWGETYAYDFFQIDWQCQGYKFFKHSPGRYLLRGIKPTDCYCWSQPIYAPVTGTVLVARDGWPDQRWLHPLADLLFAITKELVLWLDPQKHRHLRRVLGNFIIIKMAHQNVYAAIVHTKYGSIRVQEGENIGVGQHIADVGHSGQSTAPHLHFQLMNRMNIIEATGLPCCFREYERFDNGRWETITNAIPNKYDRIRVLA